MLTQQGPQGWPHFLLLLPPLPNPKCQVLALHYPLHPVHPWHLARRASLGRRADTERQPKADTPLTLGTHLAWCDRPTVGFFLLPTQTVFSPTFRRDEVTIGNLLEWSKHPGLRPEDLSHGHRPASGLGGRSSASHCTSQSLHFLHRK